MNQADADLLFVLLLLPLKTGSVFNITSMQRNRKFTLPRKRNTYDNRKFCNGGQRIVSSMFSVGNLRVDNRNQVRSTATSAYIRKNDYIARLQRGPENERAHNVDNGGDIVEMDELLEWFVIIFVRVSLLLLFRRCWSFC